MINKELISYLHLVYPELDVDTDYMVGYSDNEIKKIEKLYDIKVTGQLYDFLNCMGRCSGGFFGDDPLLFYRNKISVRGHVQLQIGQRNELCDMQQHNLLTMCPFFISIESYTQFYFLLTVSDTPDLVYHYDENDGTIASTKLMLNEYLKMVIDIYTRPYVKNMKKNFSGELIII